MTTTTPVKAFAIKTFFETYVGRGNVTYQNGSGNILGGVPNLMAATLLQTRVPLAGGDVGSENSLSYPTKLQLNDKLPVFYNSMVTEGVQDIGPLAARIARPFVLIQRGVTVAGYTHGWRAAFLAVNITLVAEFAGYDPTQDILIELGEMSETQFNLTLLCMCPQESIIFIDGLGNLSNLAPRLQNVYVKARLFPNPMWAGAIGIVTTAHVQAEFGFLHSFFSRSLDMVEGSSTKAIGGGGSPISPAQQGYWETYALLASSSISSMFSCAFVEPLGGIGIRQVSTYGFGGDGNTMMMLNALIRVKHEHVIEFNYKFDLCVNAFMAFRASSIIHRGIVSTQIPMLPVGYTMDQSGPVGQVCKAEIGLAGGGLAHNASTVMAVGLPAIADVKALANCVSHTLFHSIITLKLPKKSSEYKKFIKMTNLLCYASHGVVANINFGVGAAAIPLPAMQNVVFNGGVGVIWNAASSMAWCYQHTFAGLTDMVIHIPIGEVARLSINHVPCTAKEANDAPEVVATLIKVLRN